MTQNVNKIKEQKEDNPYDPLEIAKREGEIFRISLTGGYKKSIVAQIGFGLVGLTLFLSGLVNVIFIISTQLSFESKTTDFVTKYVIFIISLAIVYLGICILVNVFRKSIHPPQSKGAV